MRTINILLIALAAVMTACGNRENSFVRYNNKVLALNDTLFADVMRFSEKIDSGAIAQDELRLQIDSLQLRFDAAIDELNSIKIPQNAENFHKSFLALATFARDSIVALYREMQDIDPESDKWLELWNIASERIDNNVEMLEQTLIKEQSKFAEKTGIKLTKIDE
jgi:hypothetical protein